jgi:hypothetical protein
VFFNGGDPYGSEFATWMTGDRTRASYAYPPASFVVLLPMLPLPQAYALALWVTASLGCLVFLAPLLGSTLPRRLWFLPMVYYPSTYTLTNPQWAPVLLGLLGASIYLFRSGKPLWAGLLVPFMVVKPTVGLGLGLFALLWCGHDRRWWIGCVIGGLIGYVLPFLIQPDWPMRWLASVRRYADPADRQYLVTLTALWDGKLCAAIALGSLECIHTTMAHLKLRAAHLIDAGHAASCTLRLSGAVRAVLVVAASVAQRCHYRQRGKLVVSGNVYLSRLGKLAPADYVFVFTRTPFMFGD